MKICPNCQKEFPDSMRFCQTDGTPLGDPIEESQPEDPLKTTVVRQEDIASSIPPSDPFKTMVASSSNQNESGDLLQLPEEEFDPLKTMVATPIGQNKSIADELELETPKFEDIKREIKSESSPAFGGFSQPSDPLPEAPKDYSGDPTMLQPEPPKFNEPNVTPPDFGASTPREEDELPQTIMQNQWDNVSKSEPLNYSNESPYSNDSPFSKPGDSPMSSPFETPRSSSDEQPQTPFNQSSSAFDPPFETPKESSYNQPASFEPQSKPYQEPPATQLGGAQFDQMNQGFGAADQQIQQQGDWNPPPTPEQGWGDQGLGANTPFQPPVVGAGKSQVLAIVSIVLGGLAILTLIPTLLFLVCGVFPVLFGIGALITGFLARSKANQNPEQYGGGGLAMGGMITGGLSLLATIGLVLITMVFIGAAFSR